MVENRKILKILISLAILTFFIEVVILIMDKSSTFIQVLSSIILGIFTSSIVSAIMTYITYTYKYEEVHENLIKNLLEIYSNLVIFKCCYNECEHKNKKIIELENKINDYIAIIHDIEYDLVCKLKLMDSKNTIVLYKFNDRAIKEIAKGFECKNGKIIINANGLNNQKEFILSYNKMLEKVRQYLKEFCVEKYEVNYKLLKEIDNKYEDIKSESIRKISSSIDNL